MLAFDFSTKIILKDVEPLFHAALLLDVQPGRILPAPGCSLQVFPHFLHLREAWSLPVLPLERVTLAGVLPLQQLLASRVGATGLSSPV